MPAGPRADRPVGRSWWLSFFWDELVTGGFRGYAVHVQAGQASGALQSDADNRRAWAVHVAAGADLPALVRAPQYSRLTIADKSISPEGLLCGAAKRPS